jgi:hypothetical protein
VDSSLRLAGLTWPTVSISIKGLKVHLHRHFVLDLQNSYEFCIEEVILYYIGCICYHAFMFIISDPIYNDLNLNVEIKRIVSIVSIDIFSVYNHLDKHFEPGFGSIGVEMAELEPIKILASLLSRPMDKLFDLQNSYEFCIKEIFYYINYMCNISYLMCNNFMYNFFLYNHENKINSSNIFSLYNHEMVVFSYNDLNINVEITRINSGKINSSNIFSLYNHETVVETPKVALDNGKKNSQREAGQE